MRWLDRYIGIPYRDRGRSFDGCDCFGLYMLLLANEAGVRVREPDASYGQDASKALACVEASTVSGEWLPVAQGDGAAVKQKAQRFDAVLMRAHVKRGLAVVSAPLHIGVALGDGRMIHTEEDVGCRIVALDDSDICRRVTAIYRPQALAA